MKVLIESHYLPSIEYFCAISDFSEVILENSEHYVKQSFRNRCYINTTNGIEMMVVPVTGKHGKVLFRDIRIEPGIKWKNNQWRTIVSAYANAPFFEHYSDDFHRILFMDVTHLHELNEKFLSLCLRLLRLEKPVSETVTYERGDSGVFDLRSAINVKEAWSSRPWFRPQPYYQVFGSSFVENLSLVDLLFCEGPAANSILAASRKKI